jgi:hypothetical protein
MNRKRTRASTAAPGARSSAMTLTIRWLARLVGAVVCFGPPLLLLSGLVPAIDGPTRAAGWGLQALLQEWWGKLLVTSAWLGLGWLGYRALFRSGKSAA